jgi:hypothetical protein
MKTKFNNEGRLLKNAFPNTGPPTRRLAGNQTGQDTRAKNTDDKVNCI